MVSLVISGGQWGDEGKAKVTDLLSEDADYIVRYQGGMNAGHTVRFAGKTYKFHLIPSGILFPQKRCLIGPGTVIDPALLFQEIVNLQAEGVDMKDLGISPLAHVTMPWHVALDKAEDAVGSTGKGIGPTYTDKAKRIGIQVHDLLNESTLKSKLDDFLPRQNDALQKIHNLPGYKAEDILDEYLAYGTKLKPLLADTVKELYDARRQSKNILFEGAQGSLLDITFGTYPYVTSSTPIAGGACVGAGVGPTSIDYALGVFKSFLTRVGKGPFPSEIDGESELAVSLRQDGTDWAEYGTTTGRMRRVGWFDAVLGRYASRLNSFDGIALSKLDALDHLSEVRICKAYKHRHTGQIVEDLAYLDAYSLSEYEPVHQTLPGWSSDTHSIDDWGDLPQKAKDYINYIGDLLKVPVDLVSTGPDRKHSIILKNPFNSFNS